MSEQKTEANKQKMLEGYRRAYQWLRLHELGDEVDLQELRAKFGPVDYVWIQGSLASLIRDLLARLGAKARADLREANEAMVEQRESHPADDLDWQDLAQDALHIADGLTRQLFPKRDDRLRLYESSARAGYDIAEPGHPRRKVVFGE
jgi:hypothetical protein